MENQILFIYQIDKPTKILAVVEIDVSPCEHKVFHKSCDRIGAQLEIVFSFPFN